MLSDRFSDAPEHSRTLLSAPERFWTVHESSRSLTTAPESFSNAHDRSRTLFERSRSLTNAHERFPTGPTDYDRSEIVLPNGQNSRYKYRNF